MSVLIIEAVERFLTEQGYDFKKIGHTFRFIAVCRGCKWKIALICEETALICCSVFPWKIDRLKSDSIIKQLNDWNFRQCEGRFILKTEDGSVIFAVGMPILDAFSADDYIRHGLMVSTGTVLSYWQPLYKLAAASKIR